MLRSFIGTFGIVLVASAAGLTGSACGMELGTNFWNLGWHKPDDCFHNFKDVQGDNPWNPRFLQEITIYRSLRFMDWDRTNGSTRRTWSERNRKDAREQNPVAYEWMIDLCNRVKADMWVTLPHLAVDRHTGNQPCDYALRLCILVKTGVDVGETDLGPLLDKLHAMTAEDFIRAGGRRTCEPLSGDLKLYLEYSNETWNGAFKQAHYCCDEGEALGLNKNRWTAGFMYHAWAAIRLFRAADLVFGKGSPRVVRVLATHSSNPWIAGKHLEVMADATLNPWRVQADAIATAPYFGRDVDGAAPDAAAGLRAAIEKSAQHSARLRAIADAAGLRLIAYEGGQHVIKNARAVNQNPLMFGLYRQYLAAMSEYYDHFSHYCHVGRAGDGGAWGAIEYTGQPIEEAHKYRALVEFAAKNRRKPGP